MILTDDNSFGGKSEAPDEHDGSYDPDRTSSSCYQSQTMCGSFVRKTQERPPPGVALSAFHHGV